MDCVPPMDDEPGPSSSNEHRPAPVSQEKEMLILPDASARDTIHATITNEEWQESERILRNIPSIRLTFCQKLAIASGHFQNDLCAALWFSYLLLYFEKVVGFSEPGIKTSSFPGTLMLIGQVGTKEFLGLQISHFHVYCYFVITFPHAISIFEQVVDGLATPLVGYEVDQTNIWPRNYGRCKSWHLWGRIYEHYNFSLISFCSNSDLI